MRLSQPPRRVFALWAVFLTVLCVMLASLTGAPAAQATNYSVEGAINEGDLSTAVAVDQANGDVNVANNYEPTTTYSASGELLNSEFTSRGSLFGGPNYYGLAVDTETPQDVYLYNSRGTPEIRAFEALSGIQVGGFPVTGGAGHVQIASNTNGDIYYPNQAEHSVQKFSPSGGLEETIAPQGAQELIEPQSVAVDSKTGDVYVVDSGNAGATPGRVQLFNASGEYRETIEEEGAKDVTVDEETGEVFVLAVSNAACESLSPPCYRVRAYSPGQNVPFAEFGEGLLGGAEEANSDRLAVDDLTGHVYVSDVGNKEVWIFQQGTPPEVAYLPQLVTGVTASGATLHGEVNAKGNEVFCEFEYGTSTAYEHTVSCQPALVGEGSDFKPESLAISGLEGNTEYHFRLVAKTAGGEVVHGADQTFTTQQAPPIVSGVSASLVTERDATFNATINPQHLDTHYYFNYGLLPFENSSACIPPGTVPYATAPATPVDLGTSHSVAEELTGLAVEPLGLASAGVVLHPGMGSRELQPNTAYHLQVVAENDAGTNCEPEATFITLPPAPATSTGAFTTVTETTASLSGTVTPGSTGPNSDTTWRVEYGTDSNYGASTAPGTARDAGMGTSPIAVSTELEGLASNTTYHFRLVASNANDDPAASPTAAPQLAYGADRTFTTLPSEPLLDQPSGLSETEATLNGIVMPGGANLKYRYEYGQSMSYGESVVAEEGDAEGADVAPVSANVTGLIPGVTYHYRVVAKGVGGESHSPDSTFTLYAPRPEQTSSNPFNLGSSTPQLLTTPAVLSVPSFPAVPVDPTTRSKPGKALTKAQRLGKALADCRHDKGTVKRTRCERSARARYGPPKHSTRK